MPEPSVDDKETITELTIETLSGHFIDAQHFFELERLFKTKNRSPERLTWVCRTYESYELIPYNDPIKAGFTETSASWQWMLLDLIVGKCVAPLLNLPIETHHVILPNGAKIPLKPTLWKDSDGKTANLFQIKRLPDGRWLRVSKSQQEKPINSAHTKQVNQLIERSIASIESQGLQLATAAAEKNTSNTDPDTLIDAVTPPEQDKTSSLSSLA